jgi:prepilin-type N-terminal cleavage/methylation domain-containing protein
MDAGTMEGLLSPRSRYRDTQQGHTLVELLIVLLAVGILASMGIPRFTRSLEQSRVDIAAANLRAIWTAQRLYWLKHQTYASSLTSLVSDPGNSTQLVSDNPDGENFLDPNVNQPNATYICAVTFASAADFTATATRANSSSWSGTLSIGSDGSVTGSVVDPSGSAYTPSPSFQ